MIESGNVVELAPLGVRVEFERTAAQTDGDLLQFVVVGRPRGFLAQPHVHTRQAERFEVLSGSLALQVGGRSRELRSGETMEVPAGTAHRQRAGAGNGRVRVQVRPAGRTEEFLLRLAEMSAAGDFLRGGWPRPLAAAALVRDFAEDGHAARPPLRVQTALAGALLRATSREYAFVDEWDVAAPPEATFAALADARTYPEWWRPVYLDVDADGGAGPRVTSALQGPAAVSPAHPLPHRPARPAAGGLGEGRRRSARTRHVDADADPGRHTRPLRLARARGPAAPEAVDAGAAPRLPLEPRLGDRPRDGGARTVRPGARVNAAIAVRPA